MMRATALLLLGVTAVSAFIPGPALFSVRTSVAPYKATRLFVSNEGKEEPESRQPTFEKPDGSKPSEWFEGAKKDTSEQLDFARDASKDLNQGLKNAFSDDKSNEGDMGALGEAGQAASDWYDEAEKKTKDQINFAGEAAKDIGDRVKETFTGGSQDVGESVKRTFTNEEGNIDLNQAADKTAEGVKDNVKKAQDNLPEQNIHTGGSDTGTQDRR